MKINKFNQSGCYDPTPYEAFLNIDKEPVPLKGQVYIVCQDVTEQEIYEVRAERFIRFALGKNKLPLLPRLNFRSFAESLDTQDELMLKRIRRSFMAQAEEVWVFGKSISEEMVQDIRLARSKGKPVYHLTTTCEWLKGGVTHG